MGTVEVKGPHEKELTKKPKVKGENSRSSQDRLFCFWSWEEEALKLPWVHGVQGHPVAPFTALLPNFALFVLLLQRCACLPL
jgi:hypothetical protein